MLSHRRYRLFRVLSLTVIVLPAVGSMAQNGYDIQPIDVRGFDYLRDTALFSCTGAEARSCGIPSTGLPLATSTLPTDQWASYSPAMAVDGDLSTSWSEGVPGPGHGEVIAFDLPAGTAAVSVVPGYGVSGTFERNHRVRRARLSVYEWRRNNSMEGGHDIRFHAHTQEASFVDELRRQEITLPAPLPATVGGYVGLLEITATVPGSRWDDTPIAEIDTRLSATAPWPIFAADAGRLSGYDCSDWQSDGAYTCARYVGGPQETAPPAIADGDETTFWTASGDAIGASFVLPIAEGTDAVLFRAAPQLEDWSQYGRIRRVRLRVFPFEPRCCDPTIYSDWVLIDEEIAIDESWDSHRLSVPVSMRGAGRYVAAFEVLEVSAGHTYDTVRMAEIGFRGSASASH